LVFLKKDKEWLDMAIWFSQEKEPTLNTDDSLNEQLKMIKDI
jgi:hypothetical protein